MLEFPYQQVSLQTGANQLCFLHKVISSFNVIHGALSSLKVGCYFFSSGSFNVLGLM